MGDVATSTPPVVSYRGARLAPMDAAVWTAIGLLAAASLGTLFYLGSKIDAWGARVDALSRSMAARFDALAARMDAGFARIDQRLDAMDARMDALGARLDAHVDRHAS
ncbi:MAG TPA: hypothetical protein VFT80_15545 [Actinomycetota bacterium]|nr:hypothetical protein [Actinomycetota bacterium]